MDDRKKLLTKFGNFIRKTRLDLNIGLREFATKVGISATYISKMEVGDYAPPKEENIKKMAKILGINEDKLITMAGKIPSDLGEIISQEPKLYASFLRRVKPVDLEKFMKDLEGKENGKRG
jgi:HTH-type transcriptional regulator, competence development regulator